MRVTIVLAGLIGLLATGCATQQPFGGSGAGAVQTLTELPPPTGADVTRSASDYQIGPFDKLRVNVFGAEELSGEVVADGSGSVSVPLIGTLDAAGKTPTELADMIAGKLRGTYMKDPRVTVNLMEATSQTFTVDGQVKEPGMYPVRGNLSLMRAVATAKGTTEFAKLEDVVIFRNVGGKQMAALYNLGAIRRGAYADPRVYPNDVVVVGDSPGRRLFRDALQVAPALATPLVLLLQ